jgi:sugar phosphate isomerase/epimerase
MSANKLKLGVMVYAAEDPAEPINRVREVGLPTCQIGWPPFGTVEHGRRVRAAADAAGVEITTLWAGLPGRTVWNFLQGPITIGLVPPEWRQVRVEALEAAARVAAEIGVPSITTHVGFLPEYPYDPLFLGTLEGLRQVAGTCAQHGVSFWFETGQETPITLLRTIQMIGTDNLGINLDPANLLLYGKGNPVDAVDVFGEWVRGVHAKDGEYPTDGDSLGHEQPLGQGRVNFPVLVPKLKAKGFRGALTIEREISGPQQVADIKAAIALLTPLL